MRERGARRNVQIVGVYRELVMIEGAVGVAASRVENLVIQTVGCRVPSTIPMECWAVDRVNAIAILRGW